METWRHKKRGTTYEILHDNAFLQCATDPNFEAAFEDDAWVVYRNTHTQAVYVRLYEEFHDGRFERLSDQ